MSENKELKTIEPIKIEEDYSVTVTHKENLLSFFRNGANLDGLYNVVETKARTLVADVTTKKGVSQIKSTARQIASIKKRVDDLGKDVVAELKDLPKQIDANRKKWRENMEALQDEIRKPVTEIENRQAEIEEIRATHGKLALSGSEEIKAAIESIDKIDLTGDKWKESLEDATAAVTAEKGALEVMLNAALKKEALEREAEARKNQETASVDFPVFQGAAAAVNNGAQATAPVKRPSKWTDEQKKVNSAILARFAEIIRESLPKHIAGHSEQGYELAANEAAKEIIKAIACGKIENINVRY